ncbi:MAG: hypothetical protein CMP38_04940 [Rickettsiales bacterium]|nr:hypothetical protein [Rickettsiales bacterium]OUW02609.1 MAG: hypothetical protein CBD16_04025 [Betaproteobacteria bacterium TMED156]
MNESAQNNLITVNVNENIDVENLSKVISNDNDDAIEQATIEVSNQIAFTWARTVNTMLIVAKQISDIKDIDFKFYKRVTAKLIETGVFRNGSTISRFANIGKRYELLKNYNKQLPVSYHSLNEMVTHYESDNELKKILDRGVIDSETTLDEIKAMKKGTTVKKQPNTISQTVQVIDENLSIKISFPESIIENRSQDINEEIKKFESILRKRRLKAKVDLVGALRKEVEGLNKLNS